MATRSMPPPGSVIRDLCAAVADLQGPPSAAERREAGLRLLLLALILGGGAWIYWSSPLGVPALVVLPVAGAAYALLLIATHEMVHGTLLGWPAGERLLGCLLSWPMAWPFLTYGRLHRLHHRWNGRDGRDPERTEALEPERRQPGSLGRPWQRWLLPWRCLLLGGLGLIADTAWKGWTLRGFDRSLAQARLIDGLGVTALHSSLLLLAWSQGELVRYLIFWLVLERVIGAIVQARGLVEHHGLWQRGQTGGGGANHLLTQLQTSRNVAVGPWVNALMGGLPHHGAHHAFPWIPSSRLPLATARISAVLHAQGLPALPRAASYGEALRELMGPMAGSDGDQRSIHRPASAREAPGRSAP